MKNGRLVNLQTNVRTLLIENTESSTIPWTVYTNCTAVDGLSILIEIELLNVGYGTSTDIQYTIAGNEVTGLIRGTGDYYTGVGACRIFATSPLQANSISVSFAAEQSTMYLPPIANQVTAGIIGTVTQIGYPPFSRYMTSVYTDANFTLVLLDDTGANSYNQVILPNTWTALPRFIHPPNTKMRLISSALNQRYIITHYQL